MDYLEVLAGSLYYSSGRIRAGFVECVGHMLIGDCVPDVSNVFVETYVQTTACLSYIRSVACVAF